ncbi:MAG: hypothetical protein ACT4OO_01145, partial [Nitrospiraceae bacterium]
MRLRGSGAGFFYNPIVSIRRMSSVERENCSAWKSSFVCCGLVVTESTDRTDLTIEPYDFAEYEGLTSDHPLGNSDM